MFKVLAILCLAAMAVNAYDFTDTYFNQFLFNEYNMLNANAATRQRRDVTEVTPGELAKEIIDSLPENPSDAHDEHDQHNTLVILETLNPEKVDALVETASLSEAPASAKDTPIEEHTPATHEHAHIEDAEPLIAPPVETSTTTTTTTTTTKAPKTTTTTTKAPVPKTSAPAHDNSDKSSSECGKPTTEMKNDLTCCDANRHDPAYFAMIRGTKKQCAKKLRTNNPDVENFDPFNCEHVDKIKQLIICESECVAKTLDMLDEHGGFKRDSIIENFKKRLFGIEDFKIKSFEAYVDKCLNKMKYVEMKIEHGKCSPVPMEFQHCMFGEMVVGCPLEHQVKSARCQKIRDRYSSGESLALGRTSILDFVHQAKRHHVYGKA